MSLRLPLRRRARRRQLAASVVLACAAGGAAALLAAGPAAPLPLAAQGVQQVCLTPGFGINCPPSPTHSSSPPQPPPSSHPASPKPPPSSGRPSGQPQPFTPFPEPPGFVPPGGAALPTLPPPSPGAPPQPPELSVQSILLQLASDPPSKPGGKALLQATLEAQRGSDTYSVPHAVVRFTVVSESGAGADVVPAETDSGDTGVVIATVYTGDRPGDTVVLAESGSAAADITVHARAAGATPTPSPRQAVAVGAVKNGPSDSHGYLVASLAALVVAVLAGYVTAMVMGQLPNPLQRRSVWGRRSGSSGR